MRIQGQPGVTAFLLLPDEAPAERSSGPRRSVPKAAVPGAVPELPGDEDHQDTDQCSIVSKSDTLESASTVCRIGRS